ncbi:dehydrogenase E1 component subunit alpha/beta [Candidatus Kapabacteria bacterium]|nr:dehydrogenase E1 component subunit alpha/beta [Candidatus Kapabacteria bacterium]
MAVKPGKKGRPSKSQNTSISKEEKLKALKLMITARKTDEKHLTLVKQGKSFFHIGVSGHECIQVAIAQNLEQRDWGWTYYRDMAFSYAKGMTPQDYFMLAFAKKDCPSTGGRQMPGHFGNPALNLPTQSSPTGTQFLSAVGTALAAKKAGVNDVTYVASGEGTTSQGEFYEAVNWATREKLGVIFCIQDNKYAISVKSEDQIMGGTVSDLFAGYDDLLKLHIDGTDYEESVAAAKQAIEYIRAGKGPVLLHADVERLLPHSSSDDHRKYRPLDSLEDAKESRDCIKKLSAKMLADGDITEEELEILSKAVNTELTEAIDWAWEQEDPSAEDSIKENFADPSTRDLPYADESLEITGAPAVLVDGVNHALKEELARNEKILVFGEDIEDNKGGVFTATRGLSTQFGRERVFNSPLAEASIMGVALGLAVRGYKPVVEIQFGDYIWPSFMQWKNEVAAMRFRSNGGFSSAVVCRVAVGGYIHGGLCHSQNIESIFSHVPGIMIAYPSNAADAKGLLKAACRMEDPVLFCEHKGMYRLPFARVNEPDENYLLPFGKGKIVKEGSDATIVTYGMTLKQSVDAVKKIEKETGKSVEIIDLRTIVPWDKELVLESVKKTGRAIVIHEDTMTTSVSGEVVSHIADECFQYLDAPVRRLTAKDSHIPYHPNYENDVLPTEEKVKAAVESLLNF